MKATRTVTITLEMDIDEALVLYNLTKRPDNDGEDRSAYQYYANRDHIIKPMHTALATACGIQEQGK